MPATKLDFKRELAALYSARRTPELVDVPELAFLMVDGRGDPAVSPDYAAAIEALYTVSYTAKFAVKRAGGTDFTVMPLEGLWWAPEMDDFAGERQAWCWTAMIMQPEPVTADVARDAIEAAAAKKPLAALDRLRFEPFHEGLCAQVMHVGPYSAEAPTIAALHEFIAAEGYERAGKHHEIYLGDPRRTAPERLKTIIRQPVSG